jgi:hypothetical protein
MWKSINTTWLKTDATNLPELIVIFMLQKNPRFFLQLFETEKTTHSWRKVRGRGISPG